jgi:hypothetical protein
VHHRLGNKSMYLGHGNSLRQRLWRDDGETQG